MPGIAWKEPRMATANSSREPSGMNRKESASSEERRGSAWIGQGVVVEGKITSAQDLRIDGKVEGTIEVGNHGLIIGASAAVKANLAARTILICGAVIGNVTAAERLDLQATASVEGNLTAPRLVMIDGALVKGRVETLSTRASKIRKADGSPAPVV
jgi:cytoskeletal protein CcmA (bactofilin family)